MRSIEKTLILFIILPRIVKSVPLNEFYSFGSDHGDTRAPTNDDGSTPTVPISSRFPFFNHQHDSLIVSKTRMKIVQLKTVFNLRAILAHI